MEFEILDQKVKALKINYLNDLHDLEREFNLDNKRDRHDIEIIVDDFDVCVAVKRPDLEGVNIIAGIITALKVVKSLEDILECTLEEDDKK